MVRGNGGERLDFGRARLQRFSPARMRALAVIKAVMDPAEILNPGKLLVPAG